MYSLIYTHTLNLHIMATTALKTVLPPNVDIWVFYTPGKPTKQHSGARSVTLTQEAQCANGLRFFKLTVAGIDRTCYCLESDLQLVNA